MRQPVPFIGEELIHRREGETGTSPRRNFIDEILSTNSEASSWDDVVSNWPSRAPGTAKPATTKSPNARIRKPVPSATPLKATVDLKPHMAWIPINNGQGLRISISGRMDLRLREEWKRLLEKTAADAIGQFEFNLTQTPELSLTGLGMLLLFKEQQQTQRQNIKLCHCNPQIRELLQWTGMEKHFVVQGQTAQEDLKQGS